jgi:hypothetical protein
VALANKTARVAWKLMVSGERYDPAAARARRHAALHQGSVVQATSRRRISPALGAGA